MNPVEIVTPYDLSVKLVNIGFNKETVFYWTKYGTAIVMSNFTFIEKSSFAKDIYKDLGLTPAPTLHELLFEMNKPPDGINTVSEVAEYCLSEYSKYGEYLW